MWGFRCARFADLFRTDGQPADTALLDQLLPAEPLVDGGKADWWLGLDLQDADLAGNGDAGAHDDLILGNHRHGGTADRVEADIAFIVAALANFDLVADKLAQVLLDELGKHALGNPEKENRLAVPEDAGTGDDALGVHADQRDHRLAGIGGDIDDVGRQEDVAGKLLLAAFESVGLDIGRLAHALGKAGCARDKFGAGNVGAQVGCGIDRDRQRRLVGGLRNRWRRHDHAGGKKNCRQDATQGDQQLHDPLHKETM
jgi:hypothetical protein